jgi:peptidoglycan/LPS O-acetylase OafA/YrhL
MATALSAPPQQASHITALDGIRGLAVLMVLVGHGGWFNNGWMGVDLFFVLSGFLITGILRRSRNDPFYWRRFYLKRATRILPPMLLGVAAVALLWPQTTAIGIAGYVISLGNIVDCTRFVIIPLQHLWSLSVEEHFYLFWPFAVLWLPKPSLKKILIAIAIFAPLGRFCLSFLLPPHDADPIYMLTPFRIDGIALGSLLALLIEDGYWQEKLTRWSGLGIIIPSATFLFLWTVLGHVHYYPYAYSPIFNLTGYSLVAITAFFTVAYAFLRPDAFPTRLLRNRLLVKMGEISYGAYVYSWIILHLIEHYFPSLSKHQAGFLHIVVSVVVSAALFKYYERPITMWGKRKAAALSARAASKNNDDARNKGRRPFEVEELVLAKRIGDTPGRNSPTTTTALKSHSEPSLS